MNKIESNVHDLKEIYDYYIDKSRKKSEVEMEEKRIRDNRKLKKKEEQDI